MMRRLPVSKGLLWAIVDDEDYDRFSHFKWHRSGSNRLYVGRWVRVDGVDTTRYLHREILDAPKGIQVDHINRDTLDNRKANLRLCDQTQNNANSTRPCPFGYRGVYPSSRGTWNAGIQVRGVHKRLGSFATVEEAARVYDRAARRAFGEFATLNFPDEASK